MSEKIKKVLDAIADVVLGYRPKPKTKAAERREDERKRTEKEERRRNK